MLQSPEHDGPPDLDAYFASLQQRGRDEVKAPPVTIGTGRAKKTDNEGDDAATARAALNAAISGLTADAQLCHVTFALDINAPVAEAALRTELGSVPLIGRSVDKRDATGCIEVLLLSSAAPGGIQIATACSIIDTESAAAVSNPESTRDEACVSALRKATTDALTKLLPESPAAFLLFAHSPGSRTGVGRSAIQGAAPGAVAYGGPTAVTSGYIVGAPTDKETSVSHTDEHTAVVAAIPGSLSFLFSVVIKNWAQPKYTEALSYMSPNYVGDAATDLLTAIRYDDWDKFVWCIEEAKVNINHRWERKQNQIPLLAACARLRIRMVEYLLDRGADVQHRNDGGFTAAMYTRMLTEHDRTIVDKQLRLLEAAGASISLSEDEALKLKTATNGRIVE